MDGWIKLHRSVVDSSVFQDAEVLKVWIWLLCNVAYEPHDVVFYGKVIRLKAGQIATGRKKIAQKTDLSDGRVYRALKILENLGNIDIKPNNRFSLVTIVNWGKFQEDSPKVNSKLTAKSQQDNNRPTANSQQTNTTKERKERKEGKEIKKDPAGASPFGVDERGRQLNEAGMPIIDFGFKDRPF